MLHSGNLIVLSLNTVLYSNNYAPEAIYVDDPGKQFLWMRKMMNYARERQCQVIVVGHIPPCIGSFRHNQFWKDEYVKTYYDLVEEYDDVVIAQLYGHLHSDEFRVGDRSMSHMNSETNTDMIPSLRSPMLLGPSVTPLHGNFPAFRLVKYGSVGGNRRYNKGRFQLLDYHSYSLSGENWTQLYAFSEVYSSIYRQDEGLTSDTMRSIAQSMDDTILLRKTPLLSTFRSFVLSGAVGESQHAGLGVDCSEECKDEWLCTLKSATRSGYDSCLVSRRGSRQKATNIIGISLAAVVAVVFVITLAIRRRRAHLRKHYEETPSVDGEVGPSMEIEK
jgi:sphingomyelin phosphodiesterase acid-like 3